jgi:uncharacterized protein (TIGR00106 family)
MVLLDFSIYPLGKGESVSQFVARSLEIVDQSGLDYRCHDMGTTLEGDFEQVLGVVKQCFEEMAVDCPRVECSIKIDFRQGHEKRLGAKVARVEQRLGRPLKKYT